MNKKIVWILVGAVVAYIVWKKFIKKPAKVTTPVATTLVVTTPVAPVATTQGDLVSNISFAGGNF